MAAVNRVFAAQHDGLPVFGPDGESIGKVRDLVIGLRVDRQPPREVDEQLLRRVEDPVADGVAREADTFGGEQIDGFEKVEQHISTEREIAVASMAADGIIDQILAHGNRRFAPAAGKLFMAISNLLLWASLR